MARKRQGVTQENADAVMIFFKNRLEAYNIEGLFLDENRFYKAKEALEAIPKALACNYLHYENCRKNLAKARSEHTKKMFEESMVYVAKGSLVIDHVALDQWVLKHVTPEGWKRCLNNIRQNKFSREHRIEIKQVKIDRYTANRLRDISAKRNDPSLDHTLQILTEIAELVGYVKNNSLEKLRDNLQKKLASQ